MKKKVWDNTCKVSKSRVELTFESKADTTVPVYYTKESFVNGKPDEIIVLKANERKTTIINKPEIYRFGVTQYDPITLKRLSANTDITFAGVKGTVLDGFRLFDSATGLVDTDLTYLDTSKMTNTQAMFQSCTALISLDTSKWDTSNVTNMSYMFNFCYDLTSLDVSGWDTSNVTDMSCMFKVCKTFKSLDLSNFDTSKVTDMQWMFGQCNLLESLDVLKFNTSNVTNMQNMFFNCKALNSLDLSGWDTSKVTTMQDMFSYCNALKTLNVSGWDISNVTNMWAIFYYCNNLCLTNFESFLNKDFSKVSDTRGMFTNCFNILKNPTDADYITSINKIDLSNFSVIGQEMFYGVQAYKWVPIKIGKNIKQISLIGDNDTYGDWMPYGVDHFEVEDNDLVYTSDDKKLLISKDGKMLYDVADNIEGTLVIPEGIEKIRTGCARTLSSANMNNIKQIPEYEYDKLPDDFYLKSYRGVDTIDLPSTLTFIGNRVMQYTDAASNNPVLKTIICRAIEPPIVKDNTFLSYRGRNNLTLKVPSESIDKYKAANQWKNFKDIQAIQ